MKGIILEWLLLVNLLVIMSSHGGDAKASVERPPKPKSEHRQLRFSCPPCDHEGFECNNLTRNDCPWGFVLDVCECCKVCAKAPGESCGGQWNLGGTCGKGMECFGETEEWGEKGRLGDTDAEIPEGKGLCTPIKRRNKYCACGLSWKKVTKA